MDTINVKIFKYIHLQLFIVDIIMIATNRMFNTFIICILYGEVKIQNGTYSHPHKKFIKSVQ